MQHASQGWKWLTHKRFDEEKYKLWRDKIKADPTLELPKEREGRIAWFTIKATGAKDDAYTPLDDLLSRSWTDGDQQDITLRNELIRTVENLMLKRGIRFTLSLHPIRVKLLAGTTERHVANTAEAMHYLVKATRLRAQPGGKALVRKFIDHLKGYLPGNSIRLEDDFEASFMINNLIDAIRIQGHMRGPNFWNRLEQQIANEDPSLRRAFKWSLIFPFKLIKGFWSNRRSSTFSYVERPPDHLFRMWLRDGWGAVKQAYRQRLGVSVHLDHALRMARRSIYLAVMVGTVVFIKQNDYLAWRQYELATLTPEAVQEERFKAPPQVKRNKAMERWWRSYLLSHDNQMPDKASLKFANDHLADLKKIEPDTLIANNKETIDKLDREFLEGFLHAYWYSQIILPDEAFYPARPS